MTPSSLEDLLSVKSARIAELEAALEVLRVEVGRRMGALPGMPEPGIGLKMVAEMSIPSSVLSWCLGALNGTAASPMAARIATLEAALRASKLQHFACEDAFYSCTIAEPDNAERTGPGCTCGAERHNERIDAVLGSTAPTSTHEAKGRK